MIKNKEILGMVDKLVGKYVIITDKESNYCGEWGIVKMFDGDLYHVGIANDNKSAVVFDREQFKIPRNQKHYMSLCDVVK